MSNAEPVATPRPPGFKSGGKGTELLTTTDIWTVLGLGVMTPFAWLVPERYWGAVVGMLTPAAVSLNVGGTRAIAARLDRFFGGRLPRPAETIVAESLAGYVESTLQVLRARRPGPWEPEVELRGAEHVADALARGKGAILWVSFFHFYGVIAKLAPHRAGIQVTHLSHPRHGFSGSRFGRRFLNQIHTGAEDKYLRERVLLSPDSPLGAMRSLTRRLGENGVVSITAREASAQPIVVPFLDADMPVATGAPDLAHRTGAALLPLHTVREADGRFVVTIEPPIAPAEESERRSFSERAAREYARRLEPVVRRYPEQWRSWFHLDSGETGGAGG